MSTFLKSEILTERIYYPSIVFGTPSLHVFFS